MDKTLPTLPKGHVSCLSDAFRYTRASETDIVKTFARVREALLREEQWSAGHRSRCISNASWAAAGRASATAHR